MKRDCTVAIARNLERLVDPGTLAGLSEPQVLARFVDRGDPVAFEAIVVRYGPMVLAVCRGILRDANDVDDAFQATFVTLIRKAAGLKQPERLGPWLYGVAYRVAVRARRRRKLEGLPGELAGRPGDPDGGEREQLSVLHDEIERLPDKYRLPIVLCCIEEETHDEAARKLNWPIGTVHGRLSRARELLRGRLGRRGVAIPAMVASSSARSSKRSENTVPQSLLSSTLALSNGAIPTRVQALVKGVISAMFIEKLRSTALVLAATALGVGSAATALMAFTGPSTKSGQPPASRTSSQEPNPNVVTKDLHKAAGKPVSPPAVDEQEEERVAEEVGKMRADVEMLELRSEALRNRIHQGIVVIDMTEESLRSELGGFTPENLQKQTQRLTTRLKEKREDIEKWQKEFSNTRIEIARLNYRIARAPRPLVEAERDDSGKSMYDLTRRIDRLEAKVDRLMDLITKVAPR